MGDIEHWPTDEILERGVRALYAHWQREGETTSHEDVRVVLEACVPDNLRGAVEERDRYRKALSRIAHNGDWWSAKHAGPLARAVIDGKPYGGQ